MTRSPSAGWREVYEYLEVEDDRAGHGDDLQDSARSV
jgi:hypothetical protein